MTRAAGDTDHELVEAVRSGDDRAFEQLYGRYHRRIAAYVYGMVHDYGRAEDLTQDVFISALRRMRETDRPIAFKPWIYEIAKNACIDAFRRARRAEEVSYDAEEGLGAADYGKLVMGGPTPDVAVEQKLTLDHLQGAFGGLSEAHHQILVMRELEGLSYREIGERLGMSRPSVESTLFRARRRLTEEYEELISGQRCLRVQGIITAATSGPLGTRDQRKLARHVSYCQPCRRHARMAGVDAGIMARRPMREKIAAFLPLPAFLKRRGGGGDGADAVSVAASSHGHSVAGWSATVAQYTEPGAQWAKAAVAAATVVVAGVGAGTAATGADLRLGGSQAERPSVTRVADRAPAPAAAQRSAAGAPAGTSAQPSQQRAGARDAARRTSGAPSSGGGSSSPSITVTGDGGGGSGGGPAATPQAGSGTSTPAAGASPSVDGVVPATPTTGGAGATPATGGGPTLLDPAALLPQQPAPTAEAPASGGPPAAPAIDLPGTADRAGGGVQQAVDGVTTVVKDATDAAGGLLGAK